MQFSVSLATGTKQWTVRNGRRAILTPFAILVGQLSGHSLAISLHPVVRLENKLPSADTPNQLGTRFVQSVDVTYAYLAATELGLYPKQDASMCVGEIEICAFELRRNTDGRHAYAVINLLREIAHFGGYAPSD
jgi:hypothetical protein